MRKLYGARISLLLGFLLALNFLTVWGTYDQAKRNLHLAELYQHEKNVYFWKGVLVTFPSQSLAHQLVWYIHN